MADRGDDTAREAPQVGPPRGAVSAGARERSTESSESSAPSNAEPETLIADPERYQSRWSDIQIAFVDSPREAVRAADALVADVTQAVVDGFAAERRTLEAQWDRGDDVSTEQLRVALQRYRSFFERLLTL